MMNKIAGVLLAAVGAIALGGIALHRHEPINALWIVTAAVCVYALGYRFYAAWVAARVLVVDPSRATPAERLRQRPRLRADPSLDRLRPSLRRHRRARALSSARRSRRSSAICPARSGSWSGAVLGGCVQDMTILLLSTRRDGRSLGQMARDELGPFGGFAALIGTLIIMIMLIAVLGLVVVNAMKHSPWATSTVFATIPVAILVGLYLRRLRPGRVLEASLIGVALVLLAVSAAAGSTPSRCCAACSTGRACRSPAS